MVDFRRFFGGRMISKKNCEVGGRVEGSMQERGMRRVEVVLVVRPVSNFFWVGRVVWIVIAMGLGWCWSGL